MVFKKKEKTEREIGTMDEKTSKENQPKSELPVHNPHMEAKMKAKAAEEAQPVKKSGSVRASKGFIFYKRSSMQKDECGVKIDQISDVNYGGAEDGKTIVQTVGGKIHKLPCTVQALERLIT